MNYTAKAPTEKTSSKTVQIPPTPIESKQVNIGTEENVMINAGLDPKKSIDENFVDFLRLVPICLLRRILICQGSDPSIDRHKLHVNPLAKPAKNKPQ